MMNSSLNWESAHNRGFMQEMRRKGISGGKQHTCPTDEGTRKQLNRDSPVAACARRSSGYRHRLKLPGLSLFDWATFGIS
jgi:hypothetical protein